MRFIEKRLVADIGCMLKFKNDLGVYVDSLYIEPNFFFSCYPSSNVKNITQAAKIFDEIEVDRKEEYLTKYQEQLIKNRPDLLSDNKTIVKEEE